MPFVVFITQECILEAHQHTQNAIHTLHICSVNYMTNCMSHVVRVDVLAARHKQNELGQTLSSLHTPLSLSLACFAARASRKRNDADVSEDAQLKGRYNIDHNKNALVIPKPDEKDAGTYTCSVPELKETAEFNVVGK